MFSLKWKSYRNQHLNFGVKFINILPTSNFNFFTKHNKIALIRMDWNEMTCKVTYVIPRLLPRVFSDPFSLMFKSLKKTIASRSVG